MKIDFDIENIEGKRIKLLNGQIDLIMRSLVISGSPRIMGNYIAIYTDLHIQEKGSIMKVKKKI